VTRVTPAPLAARPPDPHLLPTLITGIAMPIVALIVAVVVGLWVISSYNGLIGLKNYTANAWKQIDVQLKRRHDLIPNLVNTVKGSMEFEKGTLEAVVAARAKAMSATTVGQTAAAEGALSGALGKFFAVAEAYPDLKSSTNIGSLQEELASTENKISFARQAYNDMATKYNTKQMQFPTNMVAGLAKASPAELWEITDDKEREVVNVDLSMGPKPTA
jgi:LemA protein